MGSTTLTYDDLLTGSSALSYKGRVAGKRAINDLARKISYNHAYSPASAATLSQFLGLRKSDSYKSVSTAISTATTLASDWKTRIADEETLSLLDSIQGEAIKEAINNFYNSYMASSNSDAIYRLGQVTRVKHLYTNVTDIYGRQKQTSRNTSSVLGQTDAYGRMDTTSNMRTRIDIDGCFSRTGQAIAAGYSEYYVNFFFPPFTNENFNPDLIAAEMAKNIAATKEASSKKSQQFIDVQKNFAKKIAEAATKNALATKDPNKDITIPTYDYQNLMCARDGFTYRTAAFKSVNDNIHFLQYIFEQISGIVSTYLTEWDLSIYMQEGLLSNYQTNNNVWLCNRLTLDNPQGLRGDSAYVWGALNSCVSKLPVDGEGASNIKSWIPGYYYASMYWWPYNYTDRGDGLQKFWDYALDSAGRYMTRTRELCKSVAGRIRHDDETYAAFAGWQKLDDISYYQILYTTPDDGLSKIDAVHMQEASDGYSSLTEELKAVMDGVYAEDPKLGFPDTNLLETYGSDTDDVTRSVWSSRRGISIAYNKKIIKYKMDDIYDSNSKRIENTTYYCRGLLVHVTDGDGNDITGDSASKATDSVSMDSNGNLTIMGCPIPGSSILKAFMNKNSSKDKAMSIANKANSKTGFWNPSGKKSEDDPNSAQSGGAIGEGFNKNPYESEHYSNPMGIPRLSPALYGGPHGAFSSPQALQSYFEPENPFLRPIARIDPTITDWHNPDIDSYYKGIESQYRITAGLQSGATKAAHLGRSPSHSMHILQTGYCETVPAVMYVYERTRQFIAGHVEYVWDYPRWWGRFSWFDYTVSFFGGWPTAYTRTVFPTHLGRNRYNNGPDYVEYENYYSYDYRWMPVYTASWGSVYWANDWHIGCHAHYGGQCGIVTCDNPWAPWYRRTYSLRVYTYVPLRIGTYGNFVYKIFNRPLMHSNPYLRWQIAMYRMARFEPKYDRPSYFMQFLKLKWGINRNYHFATQYFHINRSYSTAFYRLTTPYNGEISRVNVVWYGPITYSEYPAPSYYSYIERRSGEQEIIDYMLANASNPTTWHYPFYCVMDNIGYSEFINRITRGPRYLAQIPTRLRSVTVGYMQIGHTDRRRRCHSYCHYWNTYHTASYSFIEVDLEKAISFWASSNYVNKVFEADASKTDIMADWPTQDSFLPYSGGHPVSGLFDMVQPASNMYPFNFAGEGQGQEQNHGLFGIGIYSAIPGLNTNIPEQKSFEDGNEYLNISNLMDGVNMNGWRATHTPIRHLPLLCTRISSFGSPGQTYSDVPNTRFYVMGGRRYYERSLMGPYYGANIRFPLTGINADPGMDNFLKNLYLTATLFIPNKYATLQNNLSPFVTNVSSCIRTAVKMAKHQRAYLVYGKELFQNVIDPNEVINLIIKTVDKRVSSTSCKHWPLRSGQKNRYYDATSPFYNYWIEKAYDLYMGLNTITGNKQNEPLRALLNAFDARISFIDSFTNDVAQFINNNNGGYTKISSDSWSYADFKKVYEIFGNFKRMVENPDQMIEEYFYSYLNVLYEYRKFYINKRCNKQDGTLWACRHLESIIPILNTAKTTTPDFDSPLISTSDSDTNQYNIIMKGLQNTAAMKAKAIANKTQLPTDRICRLYMTVEFSNKREFDNFITLLVSGAPADQEIIQCQKWDKKKAYYTTVYVKKPKNATYRLISREYMRNKKAKDFNDSLLALFRKGTIDNITYENRKQYTDENILDCIFPIVWNKNEGNIALAEYLKSCNTVKEAEAKQEASRVYYNERQTALRDLINSNKPIREQYDNDYLAKSAAFNENVNVLKEHHKYGKKFFSVIMVNTYESIESATKNNFFYELENYIRGQIQFESLSGFIKKYLESISKEDLYNNMLLYYERANKNKALKTSMNKALDAKNKIYKKCDKAEAVIDKQVKAGKKEYDSDVLLYNKAVDENKKAKETYDKSISGKTREQYEAEYTWKNPGDYDPLHPTIAWNVPSGVDVSNIDNKTADLDAMNKLCALKKYKDYWVITIPESSWPYDIGYDNDLKIKTYEPDAKDAEKYNADRLTTIAGPFAYALFPITENQNGAIASVGSEMSDLAERIKATFN